MQQASRTAPIVFAQLIDPTVGLDWQLGGFAVDPPITSDGSTSQLVQATAVFPGGGGAADTLVTPPLGADTSQQTFLTTPHA